MRFRTFVLVSMMAFSLLATVAFAQRDGANDPITGTWEGDWGPSPNDRYDVTVELKWNGKALTGSVNSEGQVIPVKKGTYDAKSGSVHMEANAKARNGKIVHYVVEGKLEKNTLSGSWNHDDLSLANCKFSLKFGGLRTDSICTCVI
jgi:hypothetical protein